MIFRSLDGNWDWSFGRGKSDYATDSEAIAYDVKSKILSWIGDCFFDDTAGIDWKNIIGTKDQKSQLDRAIKKIVVDEYGIVDLSFFESEIIDRSYHCNLRFKTIFNETIEVKI
jgi:hypothetical protein